MIIVELKMDNPTQNTHPGNSDPRHLFAQLKKLSMVQKVSIFSLFIMLAIIPIVLFELAHNINYRLPHAAEPITPPTPTASQTVFGKAVYLDGSSYIEAANSANVNPSLGFTVEAWIKPDSLINNSYVVTKMNGSQNSFELYMKSEQLGNNDYTVMYEFGVVNSGNNCYLHTVQKQVEYTNNDIIKISQWQHVAGVVGRDGSLQIYVNGQKSTSSTNQITGVCDRTMPLIVGARKFDNSSADGYFKGLIDDVRISNVARYTANFAPTLYPFKEDSNTTILYRMEDNLLNSAPVVMNYDGFAFNNISYRVSDIVALPTSTLVPTSTPTPLPTTTPTPYSIVIPNSATNKSCSEMCGTYALNCKSVGTDTSGSNQKSWQVAKSACTETTANCNTVMKKSAKKTCGNYQSPWTNCKCSE
jgi:hypothetical protein